MKKMWKILCGAAAAVGCCALAVKLFHSGQEEDADMDDDADRAAKETEKTEA